MASPFRVFRKYQKSMLAVVCLLAMIAFVFLPIIMERMSTRSAASNPIIVKTTAYGDLDRQQLWQMVRQHQTLVGFLQRVQMKVREAGGTGQQAQQLLYQVGPATEEGVVNTWLLAQRAQDLGVTVDDAAVNDLLNGITEQKLSVEDLHKILRDFRLSQAALFDALQTQLLALRTQAMFASSLAATTPAQSWEYYQQLNRKATVELVSVPVARFADSVPAPDETTLREFFNKYKDRLPDPNSPEPGFRIPRRIAVEYLKADYEKFLATVQVSDEEIRKYYEEHKENYKREELPPVKPATPPETEAKQPPESPQPKPEEKKAAEPMTVPAPAEPATKAEATKPAGAEEAKPVEPEAAKPEAAEATKPAEDAAQEKPPADDSSAAHRTSPFMLASYQEGEASQETAPPAAPSEKSADQQTDKTPEKPAEDKAAGESKQPEQPKAANEAGPETVPQQPAMPEPSAQEKPAASAPPKATYLPLEEVRDEIRRQLAREQARKKIDELLQQFQEKMAIYHNQWIVYDATVQEQGQAAKAPPVKPNLAKFAEGTPLTAHETGLISRVEAMHLDIGDSWIGSSPFTEYAYASNLLKFKPAISQDNDGNSYLFWKTKEAEEREPDFNDPQVRQEVLRAWKMVQARDLATKAAEKLAEEARKSGKSFQEFFADRKDTQVVEAGPFTWLTYGNVPPMYWLQSQQPPRLSEVNGVEAPGTDFMRTVFHLEPGGIGVAMNHPKTSAYVVRAVEFNPLPEVLWTLFLEDPLSRYMAAGQDRRAVVNEWMDGIKESAGLVWKEKPDQDTKRTDF